MKSNTATALTPEASEASAHRPRRGRGRPSLSNEELLDKALTLFLDNGFERTSIDAIAASTGMAKRTVYLRYGDKLALFKAALQRAIDDWIIPVDQLRAAETDDIEETLLRIGRMLVANVMTPRGLRLMRITNAESARMPEISAYTYQRGTERTLAYLADLFRRRTPRAGRLADADEAALGFMNLVVSGPPVMSAWGVTLDDATIERRTSHSVRLFLHGFLPHEARAGVRPPAMDGPEPQDVDALREENRRLRTLLVETMIENAALKEGCERG